MRQEGIEYSVVFCHVHGCDKKDCRFPTALQINYMSSELAMRGKSQRIALNIPVISQTFLQTINGARPTDQHEKRLTLDLKHPKDTTRSQAPAMSH